MLSKELFFLIKRLFNSNFVLNVFLRTILNTDVAVSEWNLFVRQNHSGIGSLVHKIDFRYDS